MGNASATGELSEAQQARTWAVERAVSVSSTDCGRVQRSPEAIEIAPGEDREPTRNPIPAHTAIGLRLAEGMRGTGLEAIHLDSSD